MTRTRLPHPARREAAINAVPTQGADSALLAYRAALELASTHPSDVALSALREAALPVLERLRAEYLATGSPYGPEDGGVFRWARLRLLPAGWSVLTDETTSE